jgi:hypothetical protein
VIKMVLPVICMMGFLVVSSDSMYGCSSRFVEIYAAARGAIYDREAPPLEVSTE